MTTPSVYTSIYGNRVGVKPTASGIDQLIVNGVAVTSQGSSENANFGSIVQAPNSKFITSASAGITAHSGGGSSLAVAINAVINSVDTVGATSDSIQLPGAVAGAELSIYNGGANTMSIFPANGSTDIINALTTGVSFSLGTSRVANFTCVATGKWKSQSAAASS